MLRRRNDTSLRKPVAPVSPGSSERENPSPGVGDEASDHISGSEACNGVGMPSNPTGTVGIPPERAAVEVGGREVALALQRSQVGGYPDAWALIIQHAAVNRTSVPCTKGSKAGRTASMTWARVCSSWP
jgi:hypothetical protein